METRDTSVRNRLILWLASGLFVAALALVVSRIPSAEHEQAATGPAQPSPKDVQARASRAFARWLATSGALGDGPYIPEHASSPPPAADSSISAPPQDSAETDLAAPSSEHQSQIQDDDEALFAAMERLEQRMAAGMGRARESVLALEYTAADGPSGTRRVATGVVIDSGGDVLSVRIDPPAKAPGPSGAEPSRIIARDAFGRRHVAEWIAADPDTGLTLLRIPARVLRPIRPAAEGASLGSQVFVVGNPFGLGHSVSRGQISGLDRSLELNSRQLNGLIQIQTPLFPGDSGAVVANFRGQWLGLIRSGLAPPSSEGVSPQRGNDLGFAIPAEQALWIALQLREQGRVDRAYLGVRLESDPALGQAPEGASLRDVLPGTPAAQAGLQIGDRIVSFDGQPTRSSLDLTERLDRTAAQKYVRLEIVRGEKAERRQESVWIQTTNRPEAPHPAEPVLATAHTVDPTPTVVPTSAVVAVADLGPGAVPTPAAVAKPLGEPVSPPQAQELQLSLPRAVLERLEQLERRLDRLEHPTPPPNRPEPPQTPPPARP